MATSSEPEDPLLRLSRAVDVFLGHADQSAEARQELLARHEDLRELLEPMFERAPEGGGDATEGERYLGDFRLVREIGRGGMGVVYEAEQVSLGRRVAVKVLPAHLTLSAVQIERFRREATAAARLRHPGIVPIHFVGEDDGAHFFAMEYVDGCSLHDRLARARGDTAASLGVLDDRSRAAEAAELIAQAAEALHYAHENGVIHRDVKPHNILVGSDSVVRLVDFGLAKDLDRHSLSHTGEFAGTPQYVSPEQATGNRDKVDGRSDVFSLGIVLYELLAGAGPFEDEATDRSLAAVIAAEPRRLRKRSAHVPADLEIICHKALEKRPDDRYQTAGEMASDLRRFLRHEPIRATRPSLLTRALKLARRRRAWTAAGAAGVALTAVATAFWIRGERQEERARRTVEQARACLAELQDVAQTVRASGPGGNIDAYRGQLENLVGLYEGLLSSSDEPALRVEAVAAYLQAAELFEWLEEDAASRAMSTRAIELAGGLVAESPAEPGIRYQLAKAHFNRSRAAPTLSSERERDLTRSIALLEELAAVDGPADLLSSIRRSLAIAYTGRMIDLDGWGTGAPAPAGAQDQLERALALWAEVPEPLRARELRTRSELAWVHMARSDSPAAIRILTETAELGEAWLQQRPGDPELLQGLAIAYACLAQQHHALGDREKAIALYRRSIERRAEHGALRPRPWSDGELALTRLRLSKALRATGEETEADEHLDRAAATLANLVARFKDHPQFAGGLAEARSLEASRAVRQQAPREEIAARYRESIDLYRRTVAEMPGSFARWRELGGALSNLASLELQRDEVEAAHAHALEAVAAQKKAVEGNPWSQRSHTWLGFHYVVLLEAASRLGKHGELATAAEAYADLLPEDKHAQMKAVTYLCQSVTLAQGDEALARAYGDRAVARLHGMVERGWTRPTSLARSRSLTPLRELQSFRALVGEN